MSRKRIRHKQEAALRLSWNSINQYHIGVTSLATFTTEMGPVGHFLTGPERKIFNFGCPTVPGHILFFQEEIFDKTHVEGVVPGWPVYNYDGRANNLLRRLTSVS